jgi:hypothetical protein
MGVEATCLSQWTLGSWLLSSHLVSYLIRFESHVRDFTLSAFHTVIQAIGDCIQSIASRDDAKGIRLVILAGGFAQSKSLRRHVLSLFRGPGHPSVVLLDSPGSAIAG